MVFDVSDVDQPKCSVARRSTAHRSKWSCVTAIASVVVADWYGKMEDGTPFHGSIVRHRRARSAT